ncbi:MAG: hypothetical protein HY608_00535 [Planctomycetes bacterium]|nr:hypothetical protein [Planctomycetota bacterium]
MRFEPNPLPVRLEEGTPVTLGGPSAVGPDLAQYSPEAPYDAATVKQYVRPAGEARPIVLFFYCRTTTPAGKTEVCGCELMRRMAFSDARTAPHVGNFRWVELDVDDARNAEILSRYRVQSSPTLVLCDPLGNEISRRTGVVAAGELVGVLDAADKSCPDLVSRHDRRIQEIDGGLVEGWRLLRAGDVKGAIREFRRLRGQGLRSGYVDFVAEADRGLAACRDLGLARVRQVVATSGPDEVARDLAVLRGGFPWIREVGQAIDEAIRNLRDD